MREIERHANDAWGSGRQSVVAYDFLRVNVPISHPTDPSSDHMGNPEQREQGETGEGRKRRRSMGTSDAPTAEGYEPRDLGGAHSRSAYPNIRGRGFNGNFGRPRGNGNRGRGSPF